MDKTGDLKIDSPCSLCGAPATQICGGAALCNNHDRSNPGCCHHDFSDKTANLVEFSPDEFSLDESVIAAARLMP